MRSSLLLFSSRTVLYALFRQRQKTVLLLLTTLTFQAVAQQNNRNAIEEYMQAQVKVNHFNGNVLVAKNGDIVYQKAFGLANYDTKEPLQLNSVFNLASVTKQFTAMGILLLKEKGKLILSDSLRKFLPELPYSDITLHQLLTHTSGLPDYMSVLEPKWDHKKVAFNNDMIRFLAAEKPPVHFKPGQKYEYSNTGFALLASVIERVSGQTFGEYMAQNIFTPLGMTRTRVFNTRRAARETIPDYAAGFVYVPKLKRYVSADSLPNVDYVHYLDGIQGQGRIHSTVGDLWKWDRALKNPTLLSEATQREMLSPQVLSDTLHKAYYGYGVGVSKSGNGAVFSHTGGWPGFATVLIHYEEGDVTVIVLSNNVSPSNAIGNDLVALVFGKSIALPK
ncbi:MAG: serine hydrolase domain-containing protein [Spirosomataceae bacterium]